MWGQEQILKGLEQKFVCNTKTSEQMPSENQKYHLYYINMCIQYNLQAEINTLLNFYFQ